MQQFEAEKPVRKHCYRKKAEMAAYETTMHVDANRQLVWKPKKTAEQIKQEEHASKYVSIISDFQVVEKPAKK